MLPAGVCFNGFRNVYEGFIFGLYYRNLTESVKILPKAVLPYVNDFGGSGGRAVSGGFCAVDKCGQSGVNPDRNDVKK